MKTRNGFVSNSSSSSFIVMGCPATEDIRAQLLRKFPMKPGEHSSEWEERWQTEVGDPAKLRLLYVEGDTSHIIGTVISDVGSEGEFLPSMTYSIHELQELAQLTSEKLGIKNECKLMTGTRPC